MINKKVAENEDKLRRCHYTFYGAMFCAFVIAAITFALLVGLASQGGSGLAIYAGIMLLVFFWAIFIFYREDKILTRLIARADMVNSAVHIETVFGKIVVLDHCKIADLDLSWLKRRRIWPSYFLKSSSDGIYPRYSWQDIKCVSVSSGQKIFYWVSDSKSSDLELLLSGD